MYYIITEAELSSLLEAARKEGRQEATEVLAGVFDASLIGVVDASLIGVVEVTVTAVARRDDAMMETILSRTNAIQAAMSQVVLAAGTAIVGEPAVSPLDCLAAADLLIEAGFLLEIETREGWQTVIDVYGTPAE